MAAYTDPRQSLKGTTDPTSAALYGAIVPMTCGVGPASVTTIYTMQKKKIPIYTTSINVSHTAINAKNNLNLEAERRINLKIKPLIQLLISLITCVSN